MSFLSFIDPSLYIPPVNVVLAPPQRLLSLIFNQFSPRVVMKLLVAFAAASESGQAIVAILPVLANGTLRPH